MTNPYIAIQVVMMPRDTNPSGTIFGGVILSYIDMAGAIAARREIALQGGGADPTVVTVAVNRVEFRQPVLVGDVVRFETSVVRVGRTSITMHINVVSERAGHIIPVTDSEVVYVRIDKNHQPVPILPGITAKPDR